MRYTSFSDVERLDPEALKALLVEGEPPERVWAAWALGLRHHEGFARDLRATVAEEPHAGVRRHLVVVLAGAGESRSVRTLAVHDPDERVRATALQYVARLAGAKDQDANDLLAEVLARGAPLLQLGCIAGLRADAPPALWAAAVACVSSADRDLRWAAYEAVMRHGAFAHPAPVLARDFLNREPERSTRASALRLLHEQAGSEALRHLVDDDRLDARVLPETVDALQEYAVRLEWAEVEKLFARFPIEHGQERVLQLLAGNEGPARAPLLRLFVAERCAADRSWRSWSQSWRVEEQVFVMLEAALDLNRGSLDEAERRLRQELADFVDKVAAQARSDPNFLENVDAGFCEQEREILARLTALEVH